MSGLTKEATLALRSAGWFEGRHEDTDWIERVLRSHGYCPGTAVLEFLGEFALLQIVGLHPRTRTGDAFHFDYKRAAMCVAKDWVDDCEPVMGTGLVPIGQARSNHLTLLMNDMGNVYGMFESCRVMLGESGYDAINGLCSGRESVRLAEPR